MVGGGGYPHDLVQLRQVMSVRKYLVLAKIYLYRFIFAFEIIRRKIISIFVPKIMSVSIFLYMRTTVRLVRSGLVTSSSLITHP